jgi:hypothetical protein
MEDHMLQELIHGNPVLLLFLVLGIGYVIGGIRFGSFQLGSVAGVLLAGLLLGHLGFESNPAIQSLGFVVREQPGDPVARLRPVHLLRRVSGRTEVRAGDP